MICVCFTFTYPIEVKLNMRILRLYHNEDIPKSTSKFYLYFEKLIFKAENSFWILTNDSFKLPIDWYPDSESDRKVELNEFDSAVISQKGEYILVDNSFMKRYGAFIRDDWNELMCFYGDSGYFEKVVELMKVSLAENLIDLILNKELTNELNFEVLLNNWDSVYWELITEKDEYYEDLLASIHGEKGIIIKEISS